VGPVSGDPLVIYSEGTRFEYRRVYAYPAGVFRGFPQSVEAKADIVPSNV